MKPWRFVWLPSQTVDHAAGFASLRGPLVRRTGEGTNRWILARGRFDAPDEAEAATLDIAVDGRYRLWLNGMRLGEGPVRSTPKFARFDQYDVTRLVRPASNRIAVLVHVPGVDLAWYETAKEIWQPVFGDGALSVRTTLRSGGTTRIAQADETWRIVESPAWQRDVPRRGWGQGFIEIVDGRMLPADWTEPDFDDSAWPRARTMIAMPPPAAQARGWGMVVPFPVLVPSGVPRPDEGEVASERLVWSGTAVEQGGDAPDRLYTARIERDTGPALLPDAPFTIRTEPGRDAALLFAFRYHAGRPFIEIEARGGEEIDIAVAEALPGEFGEGDAHTGLGCGGHLDCLQVARYIARPGRQRFDRFDWSAVRAMQIMVRGAQAGLTVHRVGSLSTHYPVVEAGAFRCADPWLNQLCEIARNTVMLCMHDVWVDCPGREARQWVGDGVVMFDIAALAFGESCFALHRNFLRQTAESQRQDGLVRMFAPGDIDADSLTIPDFTLLWIIGIERYVMASGDAEPVRALFGAVERALDRFVQMLGPSGLLADVQQWHFIEWAGIDRRGESTAINALLCGALAAAVSLARMVGRDDRAGAWRATAARCADALNARHWDEERGCYVDAVDPETGAQYRRVSQHANALMLLFELAPPARAGLALKAITATDRLKLTAAPPIVPSAEPFDDHRDVVRANSFFSHFVFAGIAAAGGGAWVIDELRRGYGPMLATGTTTLWESFAPAASLCHGFSATPLYQVMTILIGVRPLAQGYARFAVDPTLVDLDHASGTVPTPFGPIKVAWRRDGAVTRISVRHPQDCTFVAGAQDDAKVFAVSAYPVI